MGQAGIHQILQSEIKIFENKQNRKIPEDIEDQNDLRLLSIRRANAKSAEIAKQDRTDHHHYEDRFPPGIEEKTENQQDRVLNRTGEREEIIEDENKREEIE